MSASSTMPMPGAGGMGGDPSAGAAPDMDAGSGSDVLVSICSDGQGGYLVYAGDESEGDSGGGDMSEDDDDAMGAGGGGGAGSGAGAGGVSGGMAGGDAPQGQPASSIGQALKIAMTILQGDASSQPGGSAEDQFAGGFSGSQSPTPASGSQKY
jgi:hypothetical protein